MKIAFIGGGNMAAALIGGLIKRGVAPTDLYAIDINDEARARTAQQFGIATGGAIDGTLAGFDAILLAVKPQVLKDVASSLAPHLSKQLVISIAAGIRASDLSRWLGGYARIVRTMPNTPALIGMGVTGLAALPGVDDDAKTLASRVLEAVGSAVWFDDEAKIDAVTAISGSGPAYVFYFIEAMQEAARQLGMNEEQVHRRGAAGRAVGRAGERVARTRDIEGRDDGGSAGFVRCVGREGCDRAWCARGGCKSEGNGG
jgi:pyrroline-5-carboxylate reductase